jgi:L-rhamnose mutarotase
MKSFAQCLDLVDDPEKIREYIAWHERVWPEVLAGLRSIGISRMKIFLHGTRLFMYFEAPDDFDPAKSYAGYSKSPRAEAWDRMMRGYQKQVPGADPNVFWTPMKEVFDLETA